MGGMSRDDYVASARALVELRPDVRLRIDHVLALDDHRSLQVGRLLGTEEDGHFETAFIPVIEFGSDTIRGWHVYDFDDLDAARARYEELAPAAPAAPRIENAATRHAERVAELFRTRDIEGMAALLAPGFRNLDRRRIVGSDLDRASFLDSFRSEFREASQIDVSLEILATRGERLALLRFRTMTTQAGIGPSERDFLQILEVDQLGRSTAGVGLDPDDLEAAYEELDRRFIAGEASGVRSSAIFRTFEEAIAARDWDRLASCLAPGFVVDDHRSLGTLRSLSRDEWVASVRSLVEMRPDTLLRTDHVIALDEQRVLSVGCWIGSQSEGAFEIPSVLVAELGPDGFRRWDAYDLAQLDAARARFHELRPDPLRIPPNAATWAGDRVAEALEASDWQALRGLVGPDFRFDDRGRRALIGGDVETWIQSMQVVRGWPGLRRERTVVATAGERLALELIFNTTDVGEGELLRIFEVDSVGRLRAVIRFDPDDRRAASIEMSERFRSGEGQRIPVAAREALGALVHHDFERLHAVLPGDFVFHDHRRTGLGRLAGPAAFVASLAPLAELSPDFCIETLYTVAIGEQGMLDVARVFGTLAASGGAFETAYVRLGTWRGDRIVAMELFELEELDAVRARFEEQRARRDQTC
jgi:hypothetical protein